MVGGQSPERKAPCSERFTTHTSPSEVGREVPQKVKASLTLSSHHLLQVYSHSLFKEEQCPRKDSNVRIHKSHSEKNLKRIPWLHPRSSDSRGLKCSLRICHRFEKEIKLGGISTEQLLQRASRVLDPCSGLNCTSPQIHMLSPQPQWDRMCR